MLNRVFLVIVILLTTATAFAADLGTPLLTDGLAERRFFDPERLLTTGGVKYKGLEGITIEPQIGVGYTSREQDIKGGLEEAVHKVHAQAGGKIDLADTLYFSAAAKVPVYTYGLTDKSAGLVSPQVTTSRHAYDFMRLSPSTLSWTGEMGVHLGLGTDLTVYYDQNLFDSYQPGTPQPEERFGTRLIFRFK